MPLLVNSEFLLGETAFEVESRSVISSGQAEVVEVISDADACVITTKNDEVRRASRKKYEIQNSGHVINVHDYVTLDYTIQLQKAMRDR